MLTFRQHRRGVLWLGLAGVILLLAVALTRKTILTSDKPKATPVILAFAPQPDIAPFLVAAAQGLWKAQGLDVQFLEMGTGRLSFEAVLSSQAHFAQVAETPLVMAAQQRQSFVILATFCTSKSVHCVVRTDHGITAPADLRGKTLATSVGTNAEYFTDLFLQAHGLSRNDIRLTNLRPPDIVKAVIAGEVDAGVTWQPHVAHIHRALGDKATSLPFPGAYTAFMNVVSLPSVIEHDAAAAEKLLRGLMQAVEFIHAHPQETQQLVAERLKMDVPIVEQIWASYAFGLSLQPALVQTLEHESAWVAQKDGSTVAPVNFAHYINPAILQTVSPTAVRLQETSSPQEIR